MNTNVKYAVWCGAMLIAFTGYINQARAEVEVSKFQGVNFMTDSEAKEACTNYAVVAGGVRKRLDEGEAMRDIKLQLLNATSDSQQRANALAIADTVEANDSWNTPKKAANAIFVQCAHYYRDNQVDPRAKEVVRDHPIPPALNGYQMGPDGHMHLYVNGIIAQ
jgi:hypothetical protein